METNFSAKSNDSSSGEGGFVVFKIMVGVELAILV